MKPIRIGVIGAGVMGERHLKSYLSNKQVNVKFIVDLDEISLSKQANKYKVAGELSYQKIVNEIDAVSIVTPTKTHFPIANFFISHGKHVLLEKPMAHKITEANQLIKLAHKHDITLAIGHIERFNPVISYISKLLDEKKPLFIDIHREGPFDPRINDSDVISDLMIHDIDLLFYLLKESFEVKSASGLKYHTLLNDIVSAQLISENGILVNLIGSRATVQKSRSWKLVFPDECVYIDLVNLKIVTSAAGKKEKVLHFDKSNSYLNSEIDDFIFSISNKIKPRTNGEEGCRALELSSKIHKIVSSSVTHVDSVGV